VPGASRGGHARHRQERAYFAFARTLRPVYLPRPRKWKGSVRKQGPASTRFAGPVRGDAAWTNATGIGWCQRVARRKPHSRAKIGQLDGCARASTSVAEVGERRPRFREARPAGKRAVWTGTKRLSRLFPQGGHWGLQKRRRPESRWPSREAGTDPSRAFERTLRGRGFRSMEGTLDCLFGWFVHASWTGAVLAALDLSVNVRTITAA